MALSRLEQEARHHLRFNVVVSMLDGASYGLGWGFGSIGTIIPLFVSRMTDSALLIGLIPSIHIVGWQLPQLFMASPVSRLRRYKPLVLLMTIHERIPYLGLALVAFFMARLGNTAALVLTFVMLVWQGLGAGFTANPWQSMIAKIIPPDSRGTFIGAQSGLANVMISVAAVIAGYILVGFKDPVNFALCYLLVMVGMGLSYFFLSQTREPVDVDKVISADRPSLWKGGMELLRRDKNFTAYLIVRILSQFSFMGSAFYIVYGLRRFGMSDLVAGFLTAALTIASTVANALMGWLGDRLGHRAMLIVGAVAVTLSSLLVWVAPSIPWLYPVFILIGLGNVAYWTSGMALTVEFGNEATRPVYIGLSNTLVAPASFIAPLLGGWIADATGFQTTFILSAVAGLVVTALLFWMVRDPRREGKANAVEEKAAAAGV